MSLVTQYKIQNEPTEQFMTALYMEDSVFIDRDEIIQY